MKKLPVTLTVPDLGDPAYIVAAQIQQHQMLGPFLGIGHQFLSEARIFFRHGAPRACVPAMGRIVTLPSRSRTRISGLEPTMEKPGKAR